MAHDPNRPGVPGQDNTDPSSNPLTEILAAIRGISARLGALEQRFEWLDRDCLKAIKAASLPVPEHLIEERPDTEPDTDPDPEPTHVPTLAISSDGRVLISITYLDGVDVADRATWTGVFLTEAEACDALDRMSAAADDTAAHVGGHIIKRSKKGGGGDE